MIIQLIVSALAVLLAADAHRTDQYSQIRDDIDFTFPKEWETEMIEIGNVLLNNPFHLNPKSRNDGFKPKPRIPGKMRSAHDEEMMPIHPWQRQQPFPKDDENDVKLPAYDIQDVRSQCSGSSCLYDSVSNDFDFFKNKLIQGKEDKPHNDKPNPKDDGEEDEEDPFGKLRDALKKKLKEAIDELEKSLDRTRGHQARDPTINAMDRGVPRDDRPIHAWDQSNRQARQLGSKIFLLKKDLATGRLLEVNQINLNLDVDVHQKQGQGEKQAIVNMRKDHNSYGGDENINQGRHHSESDDEDDELNGRFVQTKSNLVNLKAISEDARKMKSTSNEWEGLEEEHRPFYERSGRRGKFVFKTDPDLFDERPDSPRPGPGPHPHPRDPKPKKSLWNRMVDYLKNTWKNIKHYFGQSSYTDLSFLMIVVGFVVMAQVIVLVKVFNPNSQYELLPDDDSNEDLDDVERMGDRKRKRHELVTGKN